MGHWCREKRFKLLHGIAAPHSSDQMGGGKKSGHLVPGDNSACRKRVLPLANGLNSSIVSLRPPVA